MSDLAPQFYDAYCDVNKCHPKQLYCTWHTDKSWKIELKEKIGVFDIYKEVYKRLRVLLEETHILTFEDNLNTFRTHLLQANSTKRFGQYFDTYWIPRKEKWAYCYRTGLGINTNMYVEAFHRVFKYQYLKGKYNKRVDKCLLMLLKYDRDKTFDRLIKLTKGKSTQKIRIIHQRHEQSLVLSFANISKISDDKWIVQSESQKAVCYNLQKCDECMESNCRLKCYNCFVCCHQYSCSCNDFLLTKTICKHIHLLHRSLERSGAFLSRDTNDVGCSENKENEVDTLVSIMTATKQSPSEFVSMKGRVEELLLQIMTDVKKANEQDEPAILQLLKSATAIKNTFQSMVENKSSFVLRPTNQCSTSKNIDVQRRFYSTKKRRKVSNLRLTKPTVEEKLAFSSTPTWIQVADCLSKGNLYTLKELIFVGTKFREFRGFWGHPRNLKIAQGNREI